MLKYLFIFVACLSISASAISQHTIRGRLIDEISEPLPYATVALLNPADSILKFFGVTNDKGIYQIKNIKHGEYIMQFSFVGKTSIYEKVSIGLDSPEELGDKVMKPTMLDEVIVVAEYVPVQFKSDTVEFNAKAFVVKPHAVVEDLLKKIPGVEVDETGNVKAFGEDVTKVLVDGKEFFDDDPKVATKNLPADAIEKVQVFDKKTEEAEFMGIDDGERDRTINLLLNEDSKRGYFGNATAGIGTGEHYKLDGKLYRFSKTIQAALLGKYNNVNEFGHSGHGKSEFGQQVKGLNKNLSGGLNLSYNAEGTNRYYGSYLVSSTKKDLEQKTSSENYLKEGTYYQHEDLMEDERNTSHRINFGVRHKFNNSHNLIVDGNININDQRKDRFALTQTGINDTLINLLNNKTLTDSDQLNAYAKVVHIGKLNRDKTQLKTSANFQFNKGHSSLDWNDSITIYQPYSLSIFYQSQLNKTDRLSFHLNPHLLQKIKKFWYIDLGVRMGYNDETLNREQEIMQQGSDLNDSIFPAFNTNELVLGPSIAIRRSSNKSQLQIKLGVSLSRFDRMMAGVSLGLQEYYYFTPGLSYTNRYRKGRRIDFRYNSNVNMPDVGQLYPVVNTASILSLYQGNLDLIPEYNHNLNFSWWLFDQFSFTSLYMRLAAGYTKDKISISQTTNEDLIKLSQPINVPDFYSATSYVSFSTPIRKLGIKMEVSWTENWTQGMNIINGEDNQQTNLTHSLKLRIENRKKEKWDAGIGGEVSLTDAKFSISSMNTVYYNTSFFGDLRYEPNDHWSFDVAANMVTYNVEELSESINMPLLSAGISYYFLSGERASLSLKGYDLLNKHIGVSQSSAANYFVQQEWNTIGRYVMLEFSMRFGQHKKKSSKAKV